MPFILWVSRHLQPNRRRYEALAERLTALENLVKQAADKPCAQPVIIHHADKVTVEKIEFSNHFGTVDIKSLEGRLNIGLNYSGPLQPEHILPFVKGPHPPPKPPPNVARSAGKTGSSESGPKCNIKARK